MATIDPITWTPPTRSQMLERIDALREHDRPQSAGGAVWTFSTAISPLKLYAYLKSRFGDPNGMAMLFRSPTVDNLIHWHFSVMSCDTFIDIMSLNVRTEIHFQKKPDDEDAKHTLEQNLLAQFEAEQRSIKDMLNTFERWHLFINPYKRLVLLIERNATRLRELKIGEIQTPKMPTEESAFPAYTASITRLQTVCGEAMSLSVTLQMFAPVMGESLVNFLLLLLAKPEIRNDQRMFQDFLRRNIDIRIKSLHLCCNGFRSPITGSEDEFKNFMRLMQRRNESVHGNIDPTKRTGGEIYFDHSTIPLVESHRSISEVALHNSLAHADPSAALDDVETVKVFVEFLLSHLGDTIRQQAEMVLDTIQLGYRPKTKRIGLILPGFQADIVPVGMAEYGQPVKPHDAS